MPVGRRAALFSRSCASWVWLGAGKYSHQFDGVNAGVDFEAQSPKYVARTRSIDIRCHRTAANVDVRALTT